MLFGDYYIFTIMDKVRYILPLVVILFLLSSCEKTEPAPINVVSVDQEFEVFPSQNISEDGSAFYLTIRTVEVQSCLNADLMASMEILEDKIIIDIDGIEAPENCIEGESFPKRDFLLPNIPKQYNIEFLIGELVSTTGQLIITDNSIAMDIDMLGAVYIMGAMLNKIEENYYWGFVVRKEGVSPNTSIIPLEEARDELYSILADRQDIEAGQYDVFEILDDGTVMIEGMKDEALGMAFQLNGDDLNKNWEKLKFHMETIAESRNDIHFSIYNGQGENYNNF